MKAITETAERILDICGVPQGEQRDCLRGQIILAIADQRRELNRAAQMKLAEFRMELEYLLEPREDSDRESEDRC